MDILIIWGIGIAFLIIIAIVNKIKKAKGIEKVAVESHHYPLDIGKEIDFPNTGGYRKNKF